MTDPNKTEIIAILDRSGSMQSIKTDTEGGFNALIEEQKKTPGECVVTLVQFDNQYETVYQGRPIAEVPPLQLTPRGGTALLDAIGKTISTTGERLAHLVEHQRPGKIVVMILTDGFENASREFTHHTVNQMVKTQTNQFAWQFIFMGANQDAILVGMGLGINATNSLSYAGANVKDAFASTSRNVAGLRTSGLLAGYSDADRKQAAGEDWSNEDESARKAQQAQRAESGRGQ